MKAMRSIRKKTLIFISGILLQLTAFTQSGDSISQQFERYSLHNLQEKIFVHTDKSFYLVGEIFWFKVYVTDAVFNKPSEISKVSYVEILNKDSKAVLQAKIEINSGSGNGSFMLPSFLATGNYVVRAYTNWMKNADPVFYFEKNISIVNTLKNAGQGTNDSSSFNVQFFPEGGQMVNELPATVAFHLNDKYEIGISGRGYLLNQDNDTIVQFSPAHFGIGKFSFIPKTGNQYRSIIRFSSGKTVTKQLPAAYDEGYVMKVSEPDTAHLQVVVSSNIASAHLAFLFIHTRSRFKALVQQFFTNRKAVFIIDKKDLDDGITHFTVFNNNRQPVCERLYFKRPAKNLDIDISLQQNTFSQRAKVDLEVFTHNKQSIVSDADMSVSAFLIDSLQAMNEPDILTYLQLTSDLTGHVESPGWYLNNNSPEADEAADNLMLTHGWRRFKWEEILQNQKAYFDYLPEVEGAVITGKVSDKRTGLPANNITTYLSVPGQHFQFATTSSNSKGDLIFNVGKFYGSNEFIAQTNNLQDSNYRVEIANPFTDKISSRTFSSLTLPQNWKEQLRNRSIYAQAENAYLKEAWQQFNFSTETDTSHFYGKPDKTYYLDDYTRFTTMEEVMHEYVAEVRVRKPANYSFRVRRPNSLAYFDSDPLVLLDGVPVFNVNKIMETDPLKIKKMDIITHKYYSGSYITDGIISYSSYDGDMGGYQLDPNGLVVEYEGLQREREFYSPQYTNPEKQGSRIPDFRNVLYWSPSLKTNEEGRQKISFYTSDVPGKYAVMVQGITPEGLAGSKVITFIVE